VAMLGDSLRRRRPKDKPAPTARKPTRRTGGGGFLFWLRWLGIAVLAAAVCFGVGFLLSTLVLFPKPDTAGTGIEVPRLYGLDRSEADAELSEAGLEVGPVTELASLEAPRGRVLAQDPIPGQQLRRGAAVSYVISSGRPEIRVPPVAGLTAGTARELLEDAGFEVEIEQVRTRDVEEGSVTRTDPEGGTPLTLPARVSLIIAAGAPVDSVAPGDSTAARPDSLREVRPLRPDAAADSGAGAG
jgi:beta-lactam-binding protein with PASTA domain